jgi:hypothetical protein
VRLEAASSEAPCEIPATISRYSCGVGSERLGPNRSLAMPDEAPPFRRSRRQELNHHQEVIPTHKQIEVLHLRHGLERPQLPPVGPGCP